MSAHGSNPSLHRIVVDHFDHMPPLVTFYCDGDRTSPCHNYPACEHEAWTDECKAMHPDVPHDECWMISWLTATTWDDVAEDDSLTSETVRSGYIDTEWQGDFLTWSYATGVTA